MNNAKDKIIFRKQENLIHIETETRDEKIQHLLKQFQNDCLNKLNFVDKNIFILKKPSLVKQFKERVLQQLHRVKDLDSVMEKLKKIDNYEYILDHAFTILEELSKAYNENSFIYIIDHIIEESKNYQRKKIPVQISVENIRTALLDIAESSLKLGLDSYFKKN